MRLPHVLCSVLMLALGGARAHAYSAGVTGYSGKTGLNCSQCHIADGAPNPTATVTGPATLTAGQRGVFTFRLTGGPATRGGLNISTTAGALAPVSLETALTGGELRHATALAPQGGTFTATFEVTAPAQPGTFQIYAAGVSANGNGVTTGDGVSTMVLDVRVEAGVAPPPATVPGPVQGGAGNPAPPSAGDVTTDPGTPTVAQAATATVINGTPESIALNVLGADDNGETGLTYTWEMVRGPAPVRLERNSTNAAKSTRATLQAAGGYRFRVVIRDGQGWQNQSFAEVSVAARQTGFIVVPSSAGVETGGTRKFRTQSVDQFGNMLDAEPPATWQVPSAAGVMAADGTFTASAEPGGPFQVTATANGRTATARLLVSGGSAPRLTLAPVPNDGVVSAATTDIQVTADDDGGLGALEVQWTQIAGPAGGASFAEANAESPANAKVTLTRPGTYRFVATATDASLLTANVEVDLRTKTSLTVTPSALTMGVGQTAKLTALIEDSVLAPDLLPATVAWSEEGGLTVDADGNVSAAPNTPVGAYRVTASFYEISVVVPIQVQLAPVNDLPTDGNPTGGHGPVTGPEGLTASTAVSAGLGCSTASSANSAAPFRVVLFTLFLLGLSRRARAATAKEQKMHRGIPLRVLALSAAGLVFATACEQSSDAFVENAGDVTDPGQEQVAQELPGATRLLPALDVRRQNVDGIPDNTELFRNLDEGLTQSASDEAGTYVRGRRNSREATFAVGFSGAPVQPVTGAELHFRARGSRGGTVRVRLFDGDELIGEGPRRTVEENGYTTFIETFVGLEVVNGNNLRTELELRHPNDVSRMEVTQLMLDVTTQSTCATQQLSALPFLEERNGRGPIERNLSSGGRGAGDGRQIRIQGEAYSTGLGVRADSRVLISLGGHWETFETDIGIDDEVGNEGSVIFEVRADGQVLFTSGVRTGNQRAQRVAVNVVGKQELELIVRANGDNDDDSAVWANARLVPTASCGGRLFTYLTRDGAGSLEEAEAYYRSIGAREDYTLNQWVRDNIGNDGRVQAYFRNAIDLGFWREMVCSERIDRGVGGCMVRNWTDEEDKDDPNATDLGTVSMNVSPEGYTRFYVFAPGGALSPLAILDSEGEKYIPRLCTNCHGGQYDGVGANPDLGSVFREFEPSLLELRSGVSRQTAENEFYALNQVMKQANRALRSDAEGGKVLKTAKDSMLAYIDAIYSSTNPPTSVDVRSEGHLPDSWKEGANPVFVEAKKRLWTQFVSPYCVACHRLTSLDFTDYAKFAPLGAKSPDGDTILERYINFSESDPNRTRLALMPQSELMSNLLLNDASALRAMSDWLVQQVDPSAPQSRVDVVVQGPAITPGQELRLYGDTESLARFDLSQPGAALVQVTPGRFEASVSLPQGRQVRLKLALFEDGRFIRYANETAQTMTVPVATTGTLQMSFR